MNKVFKSVLLFALVFCSLQAAAQKSYINDHRVLMTVGEEPVTVEEFMNVYLKNNQRGEVLDQKTIDEYIKMYAEFKFKVNEAQANHLDTATSFITELAGYRKDLSKPYFVDEKVVDLLVEEAYGRMKEDIRASHILIFCNEDASPKDTLAAYKKIESIRKRIEKGENFEALAREFSEDPSARDMEAEGNRPPMKGNGGDLGYFTVFNMVYPFETAAYNTPNKSLSPIIRSSFGYHLINVTDRQPALGRALAAHIFFQLKPEYTKQQEDSLLAVANEVYQKLQENVGLWDMLVQQYSDDKGTAQRNGLLPWFTSSQMVPEFIAAVRDIEGIKAFSAPVRTDYGYHIIRLEGKKGIPSFEEAQQDIRARVLRDSRSKRSTDVVLERIREEYKYTENAKNLKKFQTACDASVLTGKWNPASVATLNLPLFTIGDSVLRTSQFIEYIQGEQSKNAVKNDGSETIATLTTRYFKTWSDETCLAYEDCRLEQKHPEFRLLLKEYHDGILLYEMIEREVWGKSTTDTIGLENFFAQNRDKYYWGERRSYTDLTASGFVGQEEAKKAEKTILNMLKKGNSDEDIKAAFPENKILISHSKAEKGMEKKVDELWDTPSPHVVSEVLADNTIKIFRIDSAIAPEPKELNETRGAVVIDYQELLEKEWLKKLYKKYPVVVNEEVLQSIKK